MVKQIKATEQFRNWLDDLKDIQGRARIQARIQRLAAGNPGVHRNLKLSVSELKIDVGPGYWVYYTQRQNVLIILLCGGDKASQPTDIELAYHLVNDLEV
ncbi:type II toxin-antitoxin system RelE/ParE family toxin [Rheinheimera aquimaris]|jgi:putative addiction module killer protein|uniref:type II toxin-antitoxin system RelE/ParE family toxin n=1 Tax=Rheinheimera aquimaris TaxID=412437 RepID=UPI0010668134|nr:type II toxin-antitoxin system RelE/ParE family toxin [Rheinheimera aquimaris]|tara:strand:- start:2307 stop:2606 length:300 start_codon:yes stop_codon:yes gene_type:complete